MYNALKISIEKKALKFFSLYKVHLRIGSVNMPQVWLLIFLFNQNEFILKKKCIFIMLPFLMISKYVFIQSKWIYLFKRNIFYHMLFSHSNEIFFITWIFHSLLLWWVYLVFHWYLKDFKNHNFTFRMLIEWQAARGCKNYL